MIRDTAAQRCDATPPPRARFQSVAVTLPSAPTDSVSTFRDSFKAVQEVTILESERSNTFVLVSHSYGRATRAAIALSRAHRDQCEGGPCYHEWHLAAAAGRTMTRRALTRFPRSRVRHAFTTNQAAAARRACIGSLDTPCVELELQDGSAARVAAVVDDLGSRLTIVHYLLGLS
ncbi:hypothetical protein A9K55_001471 [Cordyceps militaris]|uniref:Uncharacterized protein n=1 Tax=Cordyceps militaris TaxID=73501 RepID=A0A2H4SRF4_CORMI|nr:hypothetical protein A9K55_001471 [Cordyceps militaris]